MSHPNRRRSRSSSRACFLAALVAFGACDNAGVTPSGQGPAPSRGGGSSGGGGSAGPSVGLPENPIPPMSASPDAGVSAPRPGEQCAEDVKAASLKPVDLLLLVDASGSMAERVGTRTRWELAREALASFVQDTRSAGLGVGMQIFPLHSTCNDDGTCFLPSPGGCRALSACLAPGAALATGRACGGGDDDPCDPGTTCTPLGRCSKTGADCVQLGQTCATGVPDDLCGERPRQCRFGPRSRGSCRPADYETAIVPITELPAGAERIIGAMDTRLPVGSTPLGVAIKGALAQVQARVAANPDRRVALVIVSDGAPTGCNNVDIFTDLEAAAATTPPLSTYMLGIFGDAEPPEVRATVDRIAMSGGTNTPFLVTPNEKLAEGFLAALNQIRGASVPCEIDIPAPTRGALDHQKVNVRVTLAGTPTDLVYVGSADRCSATSAGWYYDTNPTMGTPTRVLLCPEVCNRVKADPQGTIELRFGCRSRAID